MTLTGSPDFQPQQAPTVTYVGQFTINNNVSQQFDISALMLPHHTTLEIFWVASGVWVSTPIGIQVNGSTQPIDFADETSVPDQTSAFIDVPGQLVAGDGGFGCVITVSKIPSGGANITGTIYVIAYTAQTIVVPRQRLRYRGIGNGTATVIVAAGATSTILGAPALGTYYVIKSMSWAQLAAPAAVQTVRFQTLVGGLTLFESFAQAVAGQGGHLEPDIQLTEGVACFNNTSQGLRAAVAYEVWSQ